MTLASLPEREFRAGLAEVVKHGAIRDEVFFGWVESNIDVLLARDSDALTYAIRRSVEIKAEVVELDERESGLRALLNFGHTFGHAIETGVGFGTWLHGEAVGAGMIMAADLSVRLGLLEGEVVERLRRLLAEIGLPVIGPGFSVDRYLDLMATDKKAEDGKIRFVLLDRLGSALLSKEVPSSALRATLERCTIEGTG